MKIKIDLNIQKPDDSNDYYETNISFNYYRDRHTSEFIKFKDFSSDKDPVFSSTRHFLVQLLRNKNGYDFGGAYSNDVDYDAILYIKDCPISIIRKNGRYRLNGKADTLTSICSALARVVFKSCFTENTGVLMQTLFSAMNLPEDIKYVLENRLPYHYFKDFEKQEVRLNVAQIGEKEFAIEIGDGVWGNISLKDLQSFCLYYLHGRKNSKFRMFGIKRLYKFLIGKEPLDSDVKVMKEFLAQNRTEDLVENRAKKLLNDFALKHSDKVKLLFDDEGTPKTMYIKGLDYDWKLTNSYDESRIQKVKAHVRNVSSVSKEWNWIFVCIDNMTKDSSLGDQFVTRALALLNDRFLIERGSISTIRNKLKQKPNENERIDLNEMS